MNTSKQQSGFSLVEVLVAISILLLALVGPMTIAAKGIQSSKYIQQQTTALFLAQEGIEAFVAARNTAALEAFNNGDLSKSWEWIESATRSADLDSCFTDQCGLDFRVKDAMTSIVDCSSSVNCLLYFDAGEWQARYSLDTANAVATPYTRVIKLSEISGTKGVQIESTVSWESGLFGGLTQDMTLVTSLFSIYE